MILLLGFAFIAGVVTILSPCILPVLPIILSGTIGGDKRKPLGIVTGFILSFTFFTLFLSAIVNATGISADALRAFSIVVILLFGVSLLVPQVQLFIEQLFSKLANSTPQQNQQTNSFWSGVVVGLSLGLLWTPCVGPILASVISLALTGSVTTTAFFITLAYSLGTAIPMLAITYGGRELLQKVPWLLKNTGSIQKAFGVLMIITAIGISLNADRKFQTFILERFPRYGTGLIAFEDNAVVKDQLNRLQRPSNSEDMNGKPSFEMTEDYGMAPEIQSEGQWFNSDPLTMKQLRQDGKVVLIDFWTYTCINCIRTLPYLRSWHEKYADKGLVIIGVHAPEFEFEKDPENVAKALADFTLQYPVVQDNDFRTWRAYNNRYWPAKYLVDKNGRIRFFHFGEGEYDETEKKIQELLKESGAEVSNKVDNPDYEVYSRTPELYLGYLRMEHLSSPEPVKRDSEAVYTDPVNIPQNTFSYSGTWNISKEKSMPSQNATLILQFESKEVFLVMNPKAQEPARMRIYLDGVVVTEGAGEDVTDGIVTIDTDRLYKLINLPKAGQHQLKLEFLDNKAELFAFTFG